MDEKQRERTIQKYSSKQNSHEAEAKKIKTTTKLIMTLQSDVRNNCNGSLMLILGTAIELQE